MDNGLTVLSFLRTPTVNSHLIGYSIALNVTVATLQAAIYLAEAATSISHWNGSIVAPGNIGIYALDTDYNMAIVCGGYNSSATPYTTGDTKTDFTFGTSIYIKGGVYTNWTLLARTTPQVAATVYFSAMTKIANSLIDDVKIPDVDSTPLLIPNNLSTSVTTGDTFTHTADCVIEAWITTLGTNPDPIDVEFRRQDDSNKWIMRIQYTQFLALIEVTAGGETNRGGVASAVTSGSRAFLTADNESISIHSGASNKEFRYNSAAAFKTETGGKITFSTGAVMHLADWDRNTVYSVLDTY